MLVVGRLILLVDNVCPFCQTCAHSSSDTGGVPLRQPIMGRPETM
jgi:hypothetical protein